MLNLKTYIYCCILFSVCSIPSLSYSQEIENNQSLSEDFAINKYNALFETKLDYINGREYKPLHQPNHDNPYLGKRSGKGVVYINGIKHDNLTLLFDLYTDQLVVNPMLFKFADIYLQINKSIIDSFTIFFEAEQYQFVQFKADDCLESINEGFYEVVYSSQTSQLLHKHIVITSKYEGLTSYNYDLIKYLKHKGKYHNINTKKKLLSLFPENKKKIKKKIKSISYSYKKFNKYQLIELIKFTESL